MPISLIALLRQGTSIPSYITPEHPSLTVLLLQCLPSLTMGFESSRLSPQQWCSCKQVVMEIHTVPSRIRSLMSFLPQQPMQSSSTMNASQHGGSFQFIPTSYSLSSNWDLMSSATGSCHSVLVRTKKNGKKAVYYFGSLWSLLDQNHKWIDNKFPYCVASLLSNPLTPSSLNLFFSISVFILHVLLSPPLKAPPLTTPC